MKKKVLILKNDRTGDLFVSLKAINRIINKHEHQDFDKSKSFLIGDNDTDLLCAEKYGIKGYMFDSNNLEKFVKKIVHNK